MLLDIQIARHSQDLGLHSECYLWRTTLQNSEGSSTLSGPNISKRRNFTTAMIRTIPVCWTGEMGKWAKVSRKEQQTNSCENFLPSDWTGCRRENREMGSTGQGSRFCPFLCFLCDILSSHPVRVQINLPPMNERPRYRNWIFLPCNVGRTGIYIAHNGNASADAAPRPPPPESD